MILPIYPYTERRRATGTHHAEGQSLNGKFGIGEEKTVNKEERMSDKTDPDGSTSS